MSLFSRFPISKDIHFRCNASSCNSRMYENRLHCICVLDPFFSLTCYVQHSSMSFCVRVAHTGSLGLSPIPFSKSAIIKAFRIASNSIVQRKVGVYDHDQDTDFLGFFEFLEFFAVLNNNLLTEVRGILACVCACVCTAMYIHVFLRGCG